MGGRMAYLQRAATAHAPAVVMPLGHETAAQTSSTHTLAASCLLLQSPPRRWAIARDGCALRWTSCPATRRRALHILISALQRKPTDRRPQEPNGNGASRLATAWVAGELSRPLTRPAGAAAATAAAAAQLVDEDAVVHILEAVKEGACRPGGGALGHQTSIQQDSEGGLPLPCAGPRFLCYLLVCFSLPL